MIVWVLLIVLQGNPGPRAAVFKAEEECVKVMDIFMKKAEQDGIKGMQVYCNKVEL